MSKMKLIIHTGPDGDYISAAQAASNLLAHPDFKRSGIVRSSGDAFYVCRNKSGSVTVRYIEALP